MKDDELKELLYFIFLVAVMILILLAVLTLKWRETSDKVDRIAESMRTEQTIEEPTTQVTATPIEPSDDEIVIDRGLTNE